MKIGKIETYNIPNSVEGRKYADILTRNFEGMGHSVTRINDSVVIVLTVKYGYEVFDGMVDDLMDIYKILERHQIVNKEVEHDTENNT